MRHEVYDAVWNDIYRHQTATRSKFLKTAIYNTVSSMSERQAKTIFRVLCGRVLTESDVLLARTLAFKLKVPISFERKGLFEEGEEASHEE